MTLETNRDKVSYIIGEDIAKSMVKEGMDLNVDIMIQALKDTLEGKASSQMTDEEKNRVMQSWQKEMQEKQQALWAEQAKQEKIKGEEFLKNNLKVEGVKQTPSGLQYTVIQEGNGAKPKATDTVKVHYHGTLLNGTVFDSSVQRNEPISFPLQQVIAGWTEGLQLMNVGSKYRFYIPSHLAYGDRAIGNIPAGSTLVFEVELLGIE